MLSKIYSGIWQHAMSSQDSDFIKEITGISGVNLFRDEMPQGNEYPACVYSFVTVSDLGIINCNIATYIFQFLCIGDSLDQTTKIADACRALFEKTDIKIDGQSFVVLFENITGMPKIFDTAEPRTVAITFRIIT